MKKFHQHFPRIYFFTEATAQTIIKRNAVYPTVIVLIITQPNTLAATGVLTTGHSSRMQMVDTIKVIIPIIAVFCRRKVSSVKLNLRNCGFAALKLLKLRCALGLLQSFDAKSLVVVIKMSMSSVLIVLNC